MARVKALSPEEASGKTKELFDVIQSKLGVIPNMMRTMGNSPAVLRGYLSFSGALDESSIGPILSKLIALAVANANQCSYCNAVHSYLAENLLKIDGQTIQQARAAESRDAKTKAALSFATHLTRNRGHVTDVEINGLKAFSYSDGEIAEIIACTALNIFTNYFNTALQVAVDFPAVEFEESVSVI